MKKKPTLPPEKRSAWIYTGGTVYDRGIIEFPQKGDLIIAADAGFLTAKRLGVAPSLLLGDFDTLPKSELPDGIEVMEYPAKKNFTDTQLAVEIAIERGATNITLVGGLDGRLDHTLSALAILEDLNARGIPAVFTSGQNRARFVRNSGVILLREHYKYFSLIAADEKVKGVTIDGCQYPLSGATLTRRVQYAVSNEIVGNCALIEIKRGGAWVIESCE